MSPSNSKLDAFPWYSKQRTRYALRFGLARSGSWTLPVPCGRFDGEDGGDGARATKKNGVTPLMCVCVCCVMGRRTFLFQLLLEAVSKKDRALDAFAP